MSASHFAPITSTWPASLDPVSTARARCQQIYYTHCTYATAALIRGDSQTPYGYSARASSLSSEALQQCCRQHLEPLLGRTYHLPPDTPADLRSTQTARTAPVRLFYEPADGKAGLLGRVCYRPFDATDERVGSYFAHFVVLADDSASHCSRALDCLRLWDAAGWQSQDSPQIAWELPALRSPESLLAGRRPAIGEAVVRSFLTADDGLLDAPQQVIPAAYRRISLVERRQIIETLLRGIIDVESAGQGGRILLVAEPGLAAMLFFAVLRLLPPQIAARYASFSTYETDLQTLPASLVATSFADPQRSELRPEQRAAAAFYFHVGRNDHTPLSATSSVYAARVVRLASEQGWEAVDRWLARLDSASAANLVELTAVEELAEEFAAQDGETRRPPAIRFGTHDSSHRHTLAAALIDHLRQAVPQEKLSASFIEEQVAPLPADLRRDLLATAIDQGQHDPKLRLWAGKLAEVWPSEWVRRALLEGQAGSWGGVAGSLWAERFRGLLPQLADPAQADKFASRLRILELLAAWLDEPERSCIEQWSRLRRLLDALCIRAARPWSGWVSAASWRWPCSDLLDGLASVLPDATLAERKDLLWALLNGNRKAAARLPGRVRLVLEQMLIWPVAATRLSQVACRLDEQLRDTLPHYAHEPPQLVFKFPIGLPSSVNMQVELRVNTMRSRRRPRRFRVLSEGGHRLVVDCEPSPSDDRAAADVWLRLTLTASAWPAAVVSNWIHLDGRTLKHNYRYRVVLDSHGIEQDDPRFLDHYAEAYHDASTGSPSS